MGGSFFSVHCQCYLHFFYDNLFIDEFCYKHLAPRCSINKMDLIFLQLNSFLILGQKNSFLISFVLRGQSDSDVLHEEETSRKDPCCWGIDPINENQ